MENQPHYRIWISGKGGQGISFLGDLLIHAFIAEKKHARLEVSSEWAIRGGLVIARVFADPAPEATWAAPENFNILLSLDPGAKWIPEARDTEALILNSWDSGAYALAHQHKAQQMLNLLMLGYLLSKCPLFSEDTAAWALKQSLGPTRLKAMPLNLEMLEFGAQLA
ncbi:hypothetical protein COW36_13425 [bacterium (Candidatus Blackallbacteria) CG17_big_fil_post_rev_8_21_14_2_50_48_46]|uniref:Uncharacterized protein n=1 Tax=bacterium (Candidatus Blackallbacteria) CG17_big_fil_post_rev_8_21_14_2_50_48_46 TaxID=2014261 RepID=A0A2M7G3B1_9BACT|nr:MAG: hypothetical protein COW64_22045 [bacterium (Candidatus Blackallbacteria) CG18_big_fil_WC_8_21_14_2_50_49_26]PIW16328.1 MAG: hypothetical protein COW36_13425 [bacterium (Candidatus Blackallbacteria) CG17_big_fil_post_rev_8_21_14_2_50_48_46]PIW45342.1 MAG: hypothetical protein COW20_20660 [bacterium (Candidatus Blackallbacteria) CG13_big_fil_rev_8_21_14_2_50_49_14]